MLPSTGVAREITWTVCESDKVLAFARTKRASDSRIAVIFGSTIQPKRALRGRLSRVLRFTIERGKAVTIDVIADRARLRQLDLAVL